MEPVLVITMEPVPTEFGVDLALVIQLKVGVTCAKILALARMAELVTKELVNVSVLLVLVELFAGLFAALAKVFATPRLVSACVLMAGTEEIVLVSILAKTHPKPKLL